MNLLLITLVIVILVAVLYIKFNRKARLLKHFPSPPRNFILGNILDFSSTKEMFPKFNEYIQKYGENVKVFLGPIPTLLLVTDTNLAEYLLTSPQVVKKAKQYGYLKRWLGSGLLISNTNTNWKKHRKIITTAFHNKILFKFIPIMKCQCDILVEKLKAEVKKPSFDIVPYITMCSLDVICETTMGTSVNAQKNPSSKYVRSIATMCEILLQRMIRPSLMFDFSYKLSSTYNKENKAIEVLHDYTNSVIAKKKLQKDIDKRNGDDEFGLKKQYAFLDSILLDKDNKDYMNDEDVRAEVDTFMFAGHDTTAVAVSFAVHLLSEHLDVQEKAANEINDVFNDSNCDFTYENLYKLKYLEAIIKETLRLYPSVGLVGRQLHEDCKYRDMTIPKGVDILIFVYAIHRSPKYYENPNDFIPERYLSENESNRSSYSYIPFGGGPRNCIGQKFAMLEMKCMLASILTNFKIIPTVPKHKIHLVNEVVLQSDNGVFVQLEDRRKEASDT